MFFESTGYQGLVTTAKGNAPLERVQVDPAAIPWWESKSPRHAKISTDISHFEELIRFQ